MTDLAVIMSIYKNDKLKFVKESVQSILSQTFTRFHYYLIFDGPVSADIEEYISNLRDIRLRLFKSQINMGLAKAMNQLLNEVLNNPEYKFIARMDADDISMPERFGLQRDFLIRHSDISCVGSWYQEIDEYGNILSNQKLPVTHDEIRKFFMRRSPFAHPSVIFRREMIDKTGLYPTNTIRLEDYLFWSNAIKSGYKFANLPEFLLQFRRDENFYKRRSGIMFGLNYISIRFKINRVLKAPLHIYFHSLGVGIVRMMPEFVIRSIYKIARRY